MTGVLTIGATFMLGLLASGHCLVMCGGISSALGMATQKTADGRSRPVLLVGYQLGRILSYTVAGLLLGGALGSLIGILNIDSVRTGLRIASALVMLLVALIVYGRVRDPIVGIGRLVWPKLAPLGRKLLPVTSLPRAIAFGMIWGWMPCGMVYSVLLLATLQLHPLSAAATMAAFGLGTAPAMLGVAFGAQRVTARFTLARTGRRIACGILLASAAVTFAAPWLMADMPSMHKLGQVHHH